MMARHPAGALVAAVALMLGACGDAGDTDRQTAGQKLAEAVSPAARAATRPAQAAQAFASKVAASDAYELAAAKLAQQLGHSSKVKAFAALMIQDHAVVAGELNGALKRTRGVLADPRLSSVQEQALARLRDAGERFDNAYARREIATHEQELAALRDYADNGMDPALSEFAADAVNMAADHVKLAAKLP
jgi:putative membrane protein